MNQRLINRNLLKKAMAQAVEKGDNIIYVWPSLKEYQNWSKKLTDSEYFPTINAIVLREEKRAGVKLSWDGFPGPQVCAGNISRLHDEKNFENFLEFSTSRGFNGPMTLIPSMETLYP